MEILDINRYGFFSLYLAPDTFLIYTAFDMLFMFGISTVCSYAGDKIYPISNKKRKELNLKTNLTNNSWFVIQYAPMAISP